MNRHLSSLSVSEGPLITFKNHKEGVATLFPGREEVAEGRQPSPEVGVGHANPPCFHSLVPEKHLATCSCQHSGRCPCKKSGAVRTVFGCCWRDYLEGF